MGQTEKEVIKELEAERRYLNNLYVESAVKIKKLQEQMKRGFEEKDAEIALLKSDIDRLKNPNEPLDTHFGEKNEPEKK